MSNKVFLIEEPSPPTYARFSHVGTWERGGLCGACGFPTSRLTQPLLIEWEIGADEIGDFSWCGYTAIVTAKVRDFLISRNYECDFGKVIVVEPSKKKKQSLWPYNGPELYWLIPSLKLEVNEEKSGVALEIDCNVCKQKRYNFKRDGLIFNKEQVNAKIFRIKEFDRSAATFITEMAMEELREMAFTNIAFHESGTITP